MKRFQVGDKVFVYQVYGWGPRRAHYTETTVSKISPKGRITVFIGAYPVQFTSDGKPFGQHYSKYYFDTVPHEERKAILEKEKREDKAAELVSNIAPDARFNVREKDALRTELNRLQALLDEARKAVEEI